MYSNAQYCADPSGKPVGIRVDINDMPAFVPLAPANTDYQNLMALVAAGELVVADAEAAPAQG